MKFPMTSGNAGGFNKKESQTWEKSPSTTTPTEANPMAQWTFCAPTTSSST